MSRSRRSAGPPRPIRKCVAGTLANIVERVRAANLRPPAVLVVGQVVGLREQLDWRSQLPLAGLRVLVTRARQQASALSARLVELGAAPLEYPTIEIRPVEDPAPFDAALAEVGSLRLDRFHQHKRRRGVLGATSRGRQGRPGAGRRSQSAPSVRARQPPCASARHAADWMPQEFVTESVLDGFRAYDLRGAEVLLARADIAPPLLADGLKRAGGACVRGDRLPYGPIT